jgi:hypothetical protein
MASLDDYDEFGNYIGADLDSDDEDDQQQQYSYPGPSQPQPQTSRPLEGFNDEDEQMVDEAGPGALMEVDGMFFPSPQSTFNHPFESKESIFRRTSDAFYSTQDFHPVAEITRLQSQNPFTML